MTREVFFLCASLCFLPIISTSFYTLHDANWFATNKNKTIRIPAKVPGGIYTDLQRAGIINDPYEGNNDINYRWIAYDSWSFDTNFNVTQDLLNHNGVYLVLHGVDTVSSIYINNVLVGTTNNMFVRYKFNIKNVLRIGTNSISVNFQSAVLFAKQQHDIIVNDSYIIPPECPPGVQKGECHPNFIRKMQASFSWDWGPSFPSQGVYKTIGIEAFDKAIIRDIVVDTINDGNWSLNTTLYLETATQNAFRGRLHLTLNNSIIYSGIVNIPSNTLGKLVLVQLNIPINSSKPIQPWYPNGVGLNTQTLYELTASLAFSNYRLRFKDSSKTIKIGFRTIELIQESLSHNALSFYFRVNGLPFFAKGSNWIPAHVFPEAVTGAYIRKLLQASKDANMNMLRVWGGGIYEPDEFYEIADELGIMIWQDFMFACALYPGRREFLNNVVVEVHQQVRRLQHHPSIALWAGNNENEAAIAGHWWPEVWKNKAEYDRDYRQLYINVIKTIVESTDVSRPYVSSSPSNGLESEKEGWLANDPQDTRYGDVHYYNYWSDLWNWTNYPSAKFASEYGFQSYPSFESFLSVTKPADWTNPISASIDHRQHHGNGGREIENQIAKHMNLPAHGNKERFIDLIYLSQINQAMVIKTETEFYRRNRELDALGNGFTMGALYWQLNDIWQAPTWASLEFGGKWKLLHYYVKDFFENLLVSPYEDRGEVKIAVVRDDYGQNMSFVLTINVFKWSSFTPFRAERAIVQTTGSSSQIVYQKSLSTLLSESSCSRRECVVFVNIENSNQNLKAENFLLLSPLKDAIGLTNPGLRITNVIGPIRENSSYKYQIEVAANSVAAFVTIDFVPNSGITGRFSKNGFFQTSNSQIIHFYGDQMLSANDVRKKLTIRSLTDVVTENGFYPY